MREHVQVISMRELSPHFHGLAVAMELSKRVNIRPVAFLTTLPQPDLGFPEIALQVIMNDIEVLEGGEFGVRRQGRFDEELALLRVDVETVPGLDADLLADAGDESVHLLIEISRIVDDVKVRMANPSGGGIVV